MKTLKSLKEDKQDIIQVTVPLFIKLMEWAREDAKSDIEVHEITERILKKNKILDSDDYASIEK